MKSTTITELTDATFDEEIRSATEPVLVDFWAAWCGPCKMLEPVLDDIAGHYDGRIRVCAVDADANPDVVRRYDVMSMPTLMVFRDGEPHLRLVGARGKARLLEELSAFL